MALFKINLNSKGLHHLFPFINECLISQDHTNSYSKNFEFFLNDDLKIINFNIKVQLIEPVKSHRHHHKYNYFSCYDSSYLLKFIFNNCIIH
jgi:hypothetical protein